MKRICIEYVYHLSFIIFHLAKRMNILVTGCNGQLGNEMQLLEKLHPEHTYYNTDVQELDITDQEGERD